MNKTPEIRLTGLDLIRSCAILFVIAGHFSLNTGFQQAIFEGPSMFIQGTMKFFFGMGVPLFLLPGCSILSAIFHHYGFISQICIGDRILLAGMGAQNPLLFRHSVRMVH